MSHRQRRVVIVWLISLLVGALLTYQKMQQAQPTADNNATIPQSQVEQRPTVQSVNPTGSATEALGKLAVKGRAPKSGYSRDNFGNGWADTGDCNMRERILARDMTDVVTLSPTDCRVRSGTLQDPYTGRRLQFVRGPASSAVQIDHVVALSNAWQSGAQQLSPQQREALANDPLELLAVDGPANMHKGDGDAATWLPPNKDYRCRYVARQVAIKLKYALWVTPAERDAMRGVLENCPDQLMPVTQ